MSKVIASMICAAALAVAPAAYAVDVQNQDNADHEIGVAIGDAAPVNILLKAGEKMKNICKGEPCLLIMNGTTWEADEDDQYVVRNGELFSQTRG